jgi:isocitrate dehydrogenase
LPSSLRLELQATRLPLQLSLMPYKDIKPPAGEKITRGQTLNVPDQPVIPFIRGDGTGPDIWAASERVFDAAVEKAYGGKKKIAWFEVYAGQAAKD